MADTNETTADIIAEMFGARTEFPFVYLMGEPDTPEVIDCATKEIIEPRKINIRRVTVKELASRLKAALKRERGDCEKMREALIKAATMLAVCEWPDGTDMEGVEKLRRDIGAALAAPPRNCDVGTAEEQAERFHHQCFEHHTGRCSPHCGTLPAKTRQECALKWAQMPYESEVKK